MYRLSVNLPSKEKRKVEKLVLHLLGPGLNQVTCSQELDHANQLSAAASVQTKIARQREPKTSALWKAWHEIGHGCACVCMCVFLTADQWCESFLLLLAFKNSFSEFLGRPGASEKLVPHPWSREILWWIPLHFTIYSHFPETLINFTGFCGVGRPLPLEAPLTLIAAAARRVTWTGRKCRARASLDHWPVGPQSSSASSPCSRSFESRSESPAWSSRFGSHARLETCEFLFSVRKLWNLTAKLLYIRGEDTSIAPVLERTGNLVALASHTRIRLRTAKVFQSPLRAIEKWSLRMSLLRFVPLFWTALLRDWSDRVHQRSKIARLFCFSNDEFPTWDKHHYLAQIGAEPRRRFRIDVDLVLEILVNNSREENTKMFWSITLVCSCLNAWWTQVNGVFVFDKRLSEEGQILHV